MSMKKYKEVSRTSIAMGLTRFKHNEESMGLKKLTIGLACKHTHFA